MENAFWRETTIRERADGPTIAMLDLWHELSEQKIGVPIEVMLADRKSDKRFSAFTGQLNTAFPEVVDNKVTLVLWLDNPGNISWLLITHELGHWILNLQGFPGWIYQPQKHSDKEVLLNSMIQHPALYALQRELGHEPQPEIDSRARHNIELFSGGSEENERQRWIEHALLLADDLINCSEATCKQLEAILRSNYPNTWKLIEKILQLRPHYDLTRPEKCFRFGNKVIQDLRLGVGWKELDNAKNLKVLIDRVSGASGSSKK